jgi:hypothetical protein
MKYMLIVGLALGWLFVATETGSCQSPRVELTSYALQSFVSGSYDRQGTLWTYDDYLELDYTTNSIYEHWEWNYPDPQVAGGWHTSTWPGLGCRDGSKVTTSRP